MGTGASVVTNVNIFPLRKYMEGRAPKKYFKLRLFPSLTMCLNLGFTEHILLKLFGVFLNINTNESGITNSTECLAYYGGRITKFIERLFVFSPDCAIILIDPAYNSNNTSQPTELSTNASPVTSDKLLLHENKDNINRIKQYGLFQYDFELWLILLWSYCTLSMTQIAQKIFEIFDVDDKGTIDRADVETMYRMLYDCDEADPVQIGMLPFNIAGSDNNSSCSSINQQSSSTPGINTGTDNNISSTTFENIHMNNSRVDATNSAHIGKSFSQQQQQQQSTSEKLNSTGAVSTASTNYSTISKHEFIEFCCHANDNKKKKNTSISNSSSSSYNNSNNVVSHLIQPALDYRNRMVNWSGGTSVWKPLTQFRQTRFQAIDSKLHSPSTASSSSSSVNKNKHNNNLTFEEGLECILIKICRQGGGDNNNIDYNINMNEREDGDEENDDDRRKVTAPNNSKKRNRQASSSSSSLSPSTKGTIGTVTTNNNKMAIYDDGGRISRKNDSNGDFNYDSDSATVANVEEYKSKVLKLEDNLFRDIQRYKHEAEDAKYYLDDAMTVYTQTDHTIETIWSSHGMRIKVYDLLEQYQIKNESYYQRLDERERLFAGGSEHDQERRYLDYIETEGGRYIRLLYTLKFCLEVLLLNNDSSSSKKIVFSNPYASMSAKSSALGVNHGDSLSAKSINTITTSATVPLPPSQLIEPSAKYAINHSTATADATSPHMLPPPSDDDHGGCSVVSITSTISSATVTANSVSKFKQQLHHHVVKKSKRELELNAALFAIQKALNEYDTLENDMMKDTLQLIRTNQLIVRPTLQVAMSRSTSESNLIYLNNVLNETSVANNNVTSVKSRSTRSGHVLHHTANGDDGKNMFRKSIKFHDDRDRRATTDKQPSFRALFGSGSGKSISTILSAGRGGITASASGKSKQIKANGSSSKAVARAMAALSKGVGAIDLHPVTTTNNNTATVNGGARASAMITSCSGMSNKALSRPQSRATTLMAGGGNTVVSTTATRASRISGRRGSSFKGSDVDDGIDGNSNYGSNKSLTHSSKMLLKLQRLREINNGNKEIAVCNKFGRPQDYNDAEVQADEHLSVIYQTKHEQRTGQEIEARRIGRQLSYQEVRIDWMIRYGAKESRWERVRDSKRDVPVLMNIDTMAVLPKHTVICQQCDTVLESFMKTCKRCDYKNITSVASAAIINNNSNPAII